MAMCNAFRILFERQVYTMELSIIDIFYPTDSNVINMDGSRTLCLKHYMPDALYD